MWAEKGRGWGESSIFNPYFSQQHDRNPFDPPIFADS
jgi:hypothetical protein